MCYYSSREAEGLVKECDVRCLTMLKESGVNRGQREHTGIFRGYPPKRVVRCSLDSCLLNPGNLPAQTTLLKY